MNWAKKAAFAAASLAVGVGVVAAPATAQETGFRPEIELRPFVGAYVPTGDQRDLVKDAVLVGSTLAVRATPALTVTGGFGWSPTEERPRITGDNTVDLFQYDVGLELGRDLALGRTSWSWRPFIGAGAGGRTYHYRDLDVDAETDFAGYGAAGVQFDAGRVGLRFEGRDYVSSFDGLQGEMAESAARNDLFLVGALMLRF